MSVMRQNSIYVIILLLIVGFLFLTFRKPAQDILSLSSGTMSAGGATMVPITLQTSSARLTGLEWQIAAPPGVTFIINATLKGKVLKCKSAHCILIGGKVPIRSGPIGALTLHVPDDMHLPITISVVQVIGVESDGSQRTVMGSSITIGPK